MIAAWKAQAKRLKRELQVLILAIKDPRTPWAVRALGVLVIGYAASPIDLIPDFIPVLGQLDDLILVPLGLALVLRCLPKEVLAQARAQADALALQNKPVGWVAAALIVAVWLLLGFWLARFFLGLA